MRIGMLAPITHPYPPPGYGPWERVTHDLTERLVADGLDVTLFAPAGSVTGARLVETSPTPLATGGAVPRLEEQAHVAAAMEMAAGGALDIVHSHLHVHALVFSRIVPVPVLTTLHGAAWDPLHHPLLRRYSDMPFVSLSRREREFLPELNYVATIPHGLATDEIEVGAGGGGYVAFVGRIAPEKAPDLAVEAAARAGVPLLMAGPIDEAHRDFADDLLGSLPRLVDYVGPLPRSDVATLIGDARGLLMPLRWDEPFGLVVIESLATGTPVVAWERGAMPEIVDHEQTGFLVDDAREAAESIERLGELSRELCRSAAVARFSDRRMASDYLSVYNEVAAQPIAASI